MKNIISKIIIFSFLLLSSTIVSAENKPGLLEDTLDLDFGIQETQLNLVKIDYYDFKSNTNKNKFNILVKFDNTIKSEIIDLAKNGHFDTYGLNGIVSDYETFVYYANKYFYFLNIIDKNPNILNNVDIKDAYLKSYKNMSFSYKQLKSTILYSKK